MPHLVSETERFAHNGSLDSDESGAHNGRNKFLGVESGGGPATQDEKMVRGVH